MTEKFGGDLIYHPLKEDETRLMRINHSGGPFLECELDTFLLQDRPNYKALSYCWTKEAASIEIRLNGQPFLVRPNLHDYLKIMSEERHICWTFIDALCINQTDDHEKGHQVKLMRQIYRDAEEVIAWLNARPGEMRTEVSQEDLDDFYTALQAFCDSDYLELISGAPRPDLLPPIDSKQLLNIVQVAFFSYKEYWSRVWIVQEVLLARVLTFRTHTLRIGSEKFRTLIMTTLRYGGVLDLFKDLTNPLTSISMSSVFNRRTSRGRGSCKSPNTSPWLVNAAVAAHLMDVRDKSDANGYSAYSTGLADAVLSYSHQSCSEPFDKVFGLLGLTTNSQLQPEYTMSRLELFLRVLIESVVEEVRFSQLGEMEKQGENPPLGETPPWLRGVAVGALLLYHLQLDAYDPVVALTMDSALKSCRRRLGSSQVDVFRIRSLFHLLAISNAYCSTGLPSIPWLATSIIPLLTIFALWLQARITALRLYISEWRGHSLASHHNPADARTPEAWVAMATDLVAEIAGNGEVGLERKYQEKKSECEVQLLKMKTLATELKAQAADDELRIVDEGMREENDLHASAIELLPDNGAVCLLGLVYYKQVSETIQAIEARWRKVAASRSEERKMVPAFWFVAYSTGFPSAISFSRETACFRRLLYNRSCFEGTWRGGKR